MSDDQVIRCYTGGLSRKCL